METAAIFQPRWTSLVSDYILHDENALCSWRLLSFVLTVDRGQKSTFSKNELSTQNVSRTDKTLALIWIISRTRIDFCQRAGKNYANFKCFEKIRIRFHSQHSRNNSEESKEFASNERHFRRWNELGKFYESHSKWFVRFIIFFKYFYMIKSLLLVLG